MRAYKEELQAMSMEPWVEVDLMRGRVEGLRVNVGTHSGGKAEERASA